MAALQVIVNDLIDDLFAYYSTPFHTILYACTCDLSPQHKIHVLLFFSLLFALLLPLKPSLLIKKLSLLYSWL